MTPPVPGCSTFEREFDNRSPFSAALLTVPLPVIADMIDGPFALASVGVRIGRHTSMPAIRAALTTDPPIAKSRPR